MYLHLVSVLAFLSLHCVLGVSQWEVINDVNPYDESGTQEDLLSKENLIPYRAPNTHLQRPPKSYPVKDAHLNRVPKVTQAPLPLRQLVLGEADSEVEDEDLLPLGVPRHLNHRRLLQLDSKQGPHLPPDMELQRMRLRSRAVNFSTACKDGVNEDCMMAARQLTANSLTQQDSHFEVLDPQELSLLDESEQGEGTLLHRQKRQINNNDGQIIEEGSGTEPDDHLYSNETQQVNQGVYTVTYNVGVVYDKNESQFTAEESSKYQKEMHRLLTKIYNDTLPGFTSLVVHPPELTNGVVSSNYTLEVNVDQSANVLGETDLEQELFHRMREATLPALAEMMLFNTKVENVTVEQLVEKLKSAMDDYCGSESPCQDAGPEYDKTRCFNTGFASGVCPHKCNSFGCQNQAECELDGDYQPFCNCGDLYEGEKCEINKQTTQHLTTGETVGVALAGTIACLALVACGVYLACCCNKNQNVDYTYYEDDILQAQPSDSSVDRWMGGLMIIPKPTAFRYTPVSSLQGAFNA